MKLKKALSQIKPTAEQREKIYGDILDKLDRLSEEPPKKEKETNIIMKRKKIITSVAAAAAAVVIAGGTVYAVSPNVRETVNNILGINRQSAEEFYDIQNSYGNNTAGIDVLGDAVNIKENDFTEFAEGIRVKLVSVMNSGTFVDIIIEFDLDEPEKAEYYATDDLLLKVPGFDGLYSYGTGSLTVSEKGRIYEHISLYFVGNVPEGALVTLKLTSLKDYSDYALSEEKKIIEGNYSTEFIIGSSVKSCSVNIEPTEIFWTQPHMDGKTAHMEMSGLSYSPKNISVDLRMLEDCFVDFDIGYIQEKYFNSTYMFHNYMNKSEFIPIKLKMSDGTLKDVIYDSVHSDAIMEFDMSDFDIDSSVPNEDTPRVTTVIHSNENAETEISSTVPKSDDWVRLSQDIPNDRPATVTFELAGIMDYTDVEAIVFCGKEFPITEKDFGINE